VKNLILDVSNIFNRAYYGIKDPNEENIGLTAHVAFAIMYGYVNKFKPDRVIAAFDSPNWRKDYTMDKELCLSGLVYKGRRDEGKTPEQLHMKKVLRELIGSVRELLDNHTTVFALGCDGLEADDIIAGVVQHNQEDQNIVVSGDSDMLQLLRYPNVRIFDSGKDDNVQYKEKDVAKFHHNPDYYLFLKCIRGDKQTDNIGSAYPRVRETKVWAAFNDDFLRLDMMAHTWMLNGNEVKVADLFAENDLLINLSAQPECVRRKIVACVEEGLEKHTKFDYMRFMGFCGQHDLKVLSAKAKEYTKMLAIRRKK